MATGYIYNGFGGYHEKDGIKGISTRYAGIEFFLPFGEVTTIPDWTFREVDHAASTANEGDESVLTYKTFTVPGARVVEEITATQLPYTNQQKGIIPVTGTRTGTLIHCKAGISIDGDQLSVEVREIEPTKAEVAEAEKNSLSYRSAIVQEYLQSKRERIAGGNGRLTPQGIVRTFMDELDVKDIDDISNLKKGGGMDIDVIRLIIEEMKKASEVTAASVEKAIATVRAGNGPQPAKARPLPRNLSARKDAYDAAIAEGKTPEEAKEIAEEAQKVTA
jgi:hypothetical protein